MREQKRSPPRASRACGGRGDGRGDGACSPLLPAAVLLLLLLLLAAPVVLLSVACSSRKEGDNRVLAALPWPRL